jgi:hypothetical protein
MGKALYILTREDLTKSQRIPQAAHALAELAGEHGHEPEYQDWLRNHRTIICLAAGET